MDTQASTEGCCCRCRQVDRWICRHSYSSLCFFYLAVKLVLLSCLLLNLKRVLETRKKKKGCCRSAILLSFYCVSRLRSGENCLNRKPTSDLVSLCVQSARDSGDRWTSGGRGRGGGVEEKEKEKEKERLKSCRERGSFIPSIQNSKDCFQMVR